MLSAMGLPFSCCGQLVLSQEVSQEASLCQKLFLDGAAGLAEEFARLGTGRGGREAVDRGGHGFFVAA